MRVHKTASVRQRNVQELLLTKELSVLRVEAKSRTSVRTPVTQGHRRVSADSPIERYLTEVLTGLAGIIGKRMETV